MLEFRRHLDYLQEHTSAFINSENFGNTFEYWLSLLAKMTVKQGVAFYTPRSLVNLLIDITKPREGMSIYDPTVGTGGMLIGAAHYIRQHGGNLESTQFYGREKLQDIWAICNMNILAHQIDNATIEHGDSLRDMEARTDTFDLVLQNIPLSLDPGNRTKTNQMTQAFLEHAVESLSPSGSAAILAPASILQQDHQDFWHQILQRDWLEAVINLPPKLLHGTNTSAVVFIFNKKKPAGRSSQVLFIRVPSNFLPHAWHNELQNVDIQSIVQAFESWGETSQFTRVIHISEIKDQNYNLSIERYPDFGEITQPFDIASALNRYHIASQKREAAVTRLMQNLAELDYPIKPSQDKPSLQ
ncbi:MAG: N-6 DNA methylase [Chloroflexota bacterium]